MGYLNMYAELNACMRKLLYAEFGCMYAETVVCKVCRCWVHVYGNFWVHVCGFWVQVYGAVGCLPECRCLPDSR